MQPEVKGEEMVSVSVDEYRELKKKAVSVGERQEMVRSLMKPSRLANLGELAKRTGKPIHVKVGDGSTDEERAEHARRKAKRVAQRNARKRNRPRKKR